MLSPGVGIAVVVLAAGACPAMMWFSHRRGRTAPCCIADGDREANLPLDELRRRRTQINAALASREARESATDSPTRTPAA